MIQAINLIQSLNHIERLDFRDKRESCLNQIFIEYMIITNDSILFLPFVYVSIYVNVKHKQYILVYDFQILIYHINCFCTHVFIPS